MPSTLNRPSAAAASSILPSFTGDSSIMVFLQMSHKMRAASFSCSMLSSASHTYKCSLPIESSTGISSGCTTCPLRNTASLVTPLIICVRSWQRTLPTASSVRINFMFIYLLFSLRKAVGGKNLHSFFGLQEGSKILGSLSLRSLRQHADRINYRLL